MSLTTFERLGLPSELADALAARRISEPFAIQTLTVPDALAGRDILGRAPTGSGKTLAFGLPALARLAGTRRAERCRPRALILSPTRELAEQIHRELEPLAGAVGRRVAAVYGGAAVGRQVKALAKGVDLLVACPGRLLDLIDQGEVSLDRVELAVVDEADRMADMGFLPDVRRILDQTAADRQTLLFSATLDGDVKTLTDRYQRDPALHEIGEPEPDLSLVEHRFIEVAKNRRLGVAADLIDGAGGPTVVFVRTRHGVDRLARQLRQNGIKAGHIHGGRTQSQRARALALFVDSKVDALVATDVAARGIHVDGVACVLHYDPPAETKDYVHRSGRTARAGAGGTVISLLDPAQVASSRKMQRHLGIEAEIESPREPQPRDTTPVREPGRERAKPKRARKPRGPAESKRSSGRGDGAKPNGSAKHGDMAKPKASPKRGGPGKPSSAAKPKSTPKRDEATKPSGTAKSNGTARRKDAAKSNDTAKPKGPSKRSESGDSKGRGAGKARAKRASKRSGRPRPPNRKGKLRTPRG